MENLQILWQLVIEYGTYVRIHKLNGLNSWNMLKPILESNKITLSWLPESISRFHEMKNMGIIEDENDGPHDLWEAHHFYLQHSRIPFRNQNDATFVRFFQIAYNAGQLHAEMNITKNPIYTDLLKRYYFTNNLNSPYRYMTQDDLSIINSSIHQTTINEVNVALNALTNNQSGGKYFQKYLQWKQKKEHLEKLIFKNN